MGLSFGGGEVAAEDRGDTEDIEEVAEDTDAGDGLRNGGVGARDLDVVRGGEGVVAGDIGERVVGGAEVVVGVGGVGGSGEAAGGVGGGDPGEAVGLGEGERAEEDSVDEAEDDDVGGDAEGEDKDRDGAEGAVAAKGAEAVADVLPEAVESGEGAFVAALLAGGLEAAEVDHGAAAGFGARHAGGDVGFDGGVDVRVEFFFDLGGGFGFEKEAEASEERIGHEATSGVAFNTSAMAELRRSQVASSVPSCFFPAEVSS